MTKYLFKMECITNLHVGNGEANYTIIDNEVQKDAVLTDVPAIYASGIKGALREHFDPDPSMDQDTKDLIFGKDNSGGLYKFFGAKLIARPLRVSDGDSAYILTTAVDILEDFSHFLKGLGLSEYYSFDKERLDFGDKVFLATSVQTKRIEQPKQIEGENVGAFDASPELQNLLGAQIAIAKTLRDYHLPVVARNKVKDEKDLNGNLWYEEIVPHESIFFFVIITPDNDPHIENFIDKMQAGPIQFGGDATVGLGYTTVTKVAAKDGGPNE